ncbi:MAG: STT3 domain-containing protein [Candidatus Aenigmatarchaeota archaeon]
MKKMKKKKIEISSDSIIIALMVLFLFFFSMWSRLGTIKTETILDYDPWWFYRYAKTILENNMKPPKWDILSFFPPGRPNMTPVGWEYTMIFFYKIITLFSPKTEFMEVAKLSPAIMVGLGSVAAFFLGKTLTNKWGGFMTGLFASMTPTFIGVSMAGYCDTDVVVVFYTFICISTIFLALKKRKIQYYVLAIISNIIFILSWYFGWYISFFFLLFIPTFFVYRLIENLIFGEKIDVKKTWIGTKDIILPLLVFIVTLNFLGFILKVGTVINFVMIGLGFTGQGKGGIVNVSVAELQPINIFTKSGFLSVAGRIGLGPIILFLVGLPSLVIYKLIVKTKVEPVEIFLFMWSALTFYLILHGVRFSLLFSCAATTAAGYVVGNLVKLLKRDILGITIFGLVFLLTIIFVSDALVYAYQASGMEVSQNWIEMLEWLKKNADSKAIIATWWDPGHIIAGYTGLRVHADGAHCGVNECLPYPHDTRIQDMGRIMTTTNETEAVELLKKYMVLTDEQCQKVKKKYGDIVPKEACEPASEMYFIASSDLIGKFTWMNYFGGFRAPISSPQDFERNPGVCCPSTPKTEPGQMSCGEFADQGRGVWVWCPWIFTFSGIQQDTQGNPVYVYDYSGLKMAIIQKEDQLIPVYNNKYIINNMVIYNQGKEMWINLSNSTTSLQKIDGLIWVDPNFRSLIYFSPSIKDSVFTKLFFFDGEGLKHFELVFSNGEIRLFRVKF